eukprot:COSAG02_NODE_345_length_24135_cov_6.425404_5_plen_94_part_00
MNLKSLLENGTISQQSSAGVYSFLIFCSLNLKIVPFLDTPIPPLRRVVAELCVLRTFGGVDFSLVFICVQSVPEFLWDRLRASIQFPLMPKRA